MTILEKIGFWGSIASLVGVLFSLIALLTPPTKSKNQSVQIQDNKGNVTIVQGDGARIGNASAGYESPRTFRQYLCLIFFIMSLIACAVLSFKSRPHSEKTQQTTGSINGNRGNVTIVQGDNNSITTRVGIPPATVDAIVSRYEAELTNRETVAYQKDNELTELRKALERVKAEADRGNAQSLAALEEAYKTGKLDLIQSALVSLAGRFSGDNEEDLEKLLSISREIVLVANIRRDHAEARKRLDFILKHKPEDVEMLNSLAQIYIYQNNPKAAAPLLERIQELRPDDAEAQCIAIGNLANVEMILGHTNEAERLHAKVLALASKENLHAQKAMALMNLGMIHLDQGKTDDAESELMKSVEILESLFNQNDLCRSLSSLAKVYAAKNNVDEASRRIARAKAIAEKQNHAHNLAICLSVESSIYLDRKEYDLAAIATEQELRIAEELRDEDDIHSAHLRLGVIYLAGGRYGKSAEHFEQAFLQPKKVDKNPDSYLFYGQALENLNRPDDAMKQYEQSLAIAANQMNLRAQLESHRAICRIYKKKDDRPKVVAARKAALRVSTAMGDKEEIDMDSLELAISYGFYGNFKDAVPLAKWVVDGLEKEKEPEFSARAYCALGELLRMSGDPEGSLEYLMTSSKLYAQAGKSHEGTMMLNNQASALLNIGEADLAEKVSNEALSVGRYTADDENIAIALANLASIYLQRDENFDKAESTVFEALAINKKLNRSRGMAVNYVTLSQISEARGDFEKTREYCRLCSALPLPELSSIDNWAQVKQRLDEWR